MSRRGRRHVRVPPDLTSLFDVLFIVIFVALIRAAAAQQAAAQAAVPSPPAPVAAKPAVPLAVAELKSRAIAQVGERPVVIARVAPRGTLRAVELVDRSVTLDIPLLEHSPDPDIALAYLGDRSQELRLCRQVALQLAAADLAGYLVIVAPDARAADLPHALYEGLRRDVARCQSDQRGLAVIVEPEGPQ